jgi:hypothetical protein
LSFFCINLLVKLKTKIPNIDTKTIIIRIFLIIEDDYLQAIVVRLSLIQSFFVTSEANSSALVLPV